MSKLPLILLLCVAFVSGCRNSETVATNSSQNINNIQSSSPTLPETSTTTSFLNGSHFPDGSDFKVHEFEISYSSEKNAIVIDLQYELGKLARSFLEDHSHKYYLVIQVPSEKLKYFESLNTQPVEGLEISDQKIVSEIQLVSPLKKGLSNKIIDQIVKDPSNYSLVVYENPEHPAKMIYNVIKN
jgi:hypothetical protein